MNNFWKEVQMEDSSIEIRTQINHERSKHVLLHSHSFYEIILCKSGNIQYLLDGNRFRLQNGDILLIPPGMSHQPLFLEPLTEPYERYVIWINRSFWESYINQYPELDFAFLQCQKRGSYLLRSTRATWSALFVGAASALKEVEEKKIGWEFCYRSTILSLMAHIGRTYYYQDIPITASEKNSLMDDIYHYINAHLTEKITLEQVAKKFLVSESTISHLFRKHFGVSFHRCVIQRRLISAKNAILSGVPIHKVWETCGFPDYSSFYRSFKKEYGISPREFKNTQIQQMTTTDVDDEKTLAK